MFFAFLCNISIIRTKGFFLFFGLLPHFNNSFFWVPPGFGWGLFFCFVFFCPLFWQLFLVVAVLRLGFFCPLILTTLFLECRRASVGLLFLFFVLFCFVKTSLFWLLFFFWVVAAPYGWSIWFVCFVLFCFALSSNNWNKTFKSIETIILKALNNTY